MVSQFERRGLRVVKGGRFFHLMGRVDKGDAVRKVIQIYSGNLGEEMLSLGLGDSENDLEMLNAVDRSQGFDGRLA